MSVLDAAVIAYSESLEATLISLADGKLPSVSAEAARHAAALILQPLREVWRQLPPGPPERDQWLVGFLEVCRDACDQSRQDDNLGAQKRARESFEENISYFRFWAEYATETFSQASRQYGPASLG